MSDPVPAPAPDAADAPETPAVGGAPAAESASQEMERLQADMARFRELAMRSQADFDNYRKRVAREKEEATRYANAALIEGLLPVLDHFELGLESARAHAADPAVVAGFEMVYRQLQDFLAANGVQPVDAAGAVFDANLHEAVSHQESEEVPEGVVARQLRKGYRLRDRLLRPASVIVSKGKPGGA